MNESNTKLPIFTLQGIDETNVSQRVNVVTESQTGQTHKFFFYDEYVGDENPNITDWVSTCVIVEGVAIASISHTSNRVDQTFGYSKGGPTPEYIGTLKDCKTAITTKI